MKLSREEFLHYLEDRQRLELGYTGTDLARIADRYQLTRRAVQKRLEAFKRSDPAFAALRYLGERAPAPALEDRDFILEELRVNPLTSPTLLADRLNEDRALRGLPSLPRHSSYRLIEQLAVGLPRDRSDPLAWFRAVGIPPAPAYDLVAARRALDSLYSYRDISFFHGVSLHQALAHTQAVEAHFAALYPGVAPHAFYDRLLPRANALPGFLASLDADRAVAYQARLVFERQALHLVEARDLLLTQLRVREGHLRQGVNSRLQKRTSELRGQRLEGIQAALRDELSRSEGPYREALERLGSAPLNEADQARALLRLDQTRDHQVVRETLAALTRQFNPTEISPHGERAARLLELARGSRAWDDLTDRERICPGKNRRLLAVVEPAAQESLRSILLTERLLEALARGKLTLPRSWEYQDLGKLVAEVPLTDPPEEWPLPPKTLEALLDGSYPLDLRPLHEVGSHPPPSEEDEVTAELERAEFTPAMREALAEVRERNPDWSPRLRQVLDEEWQGMFRMELTDDEFFEKLLQAIGYVGRNCRVRDEEGFRALGPFLQRYFLEPVLSTVLLFCHRTLDEQTAVSESVLLTDTMGIEGRRTNALATFHPRYGTVGFADLRGIGGRLVPLFSLPCSSTDTEAMNAVELVARANEVLGGSLRIYAGNGHTVSKVSAGLLFGTFGVISAGHVARAPEPPRPGQVRYLREHVGVLNRLFLLLRKRPELGRLFSSRTHIIVEGVNLRPLVESLGRLVIRRVKATGYNDRAVQPLIESSNHQKRVVRIVERGVTRAEVHRQGVYLLASEVILALAAVRRCRKGGSEGQIYPTMGLEDIAFFRPL